MKPQELASSASMPHCMKSHSRDASTLPVFTPGHLKIYIFVVFLLEARSTLSLLLGSVSADRAFAFMNAVMFDDGILVFWMQQKHVCVLLIIYGFPTQWTHTRDEQ
jgi:hypothetical protein